MILTSENTLSHLIVKYLDILEKNPQSLVFAPLAEAYRKLGLIDKALKVLKKGIKRRPDYLMGHLNLAACYVDKNQNRLAYTILRPMVEIHKDNLKLQKLFARICIKLNLSKEALEVYKHILFLYPKDQESTNQVRDIEGNLGKTQLSREIELETFTQVDLSDFGLNPLSSEEYFEEWAKVDWNEQRKLNKEKESPGRTSGPVPTHTLVDLYIRQGYLNKAKEALNKMLKLYANDEKILAKRREVEFLLERQRMAPTQNLEEKGHQNLTDLLEKMTSRSDKSQFLLQRFNDAVRKRAKERRILSA